MKMFRVTSNDLRHQEIRDIKDRMCESPRCWLEPSELRTPNHLIFKKCSQMSKPGKVREDKIRFLPLNDGKKALCPDVDIVRKCGYENQVGERSDDI